MKKGLIFICLLAMSALCFSQQDSTLIKFLFPSNKDLRIRDKLLGIQQINIECTDNLIRGKKFFLTISEFQKGKIIRNDTSNAYCGSEVIPLKVGSNLINMHVDFCDKMSFMKTDSVYVLSIIGILKNNDFNMVINYPGKTSNISLKGNDTYELRWVNSCSGTNEMKIPINKKYPVLTYAPPVRSQNDKYNSYCIQGEANVDSWFDSFRIEHYYVFYLDVK
jgi:hypothetical protein